MLSPGMVTKTNCPEVAPLSHCTVMLAPGVVVLPPHRVFEAGAVVSFPTQTLKPAILRCIRVSTHRPGDSR